MKPLTMTIDGKQVATYYIDERYNLIYFFDKSRKMITRERFYMKEFKGKDLEKHLIKKFGDKTK